MNVDTPRFEVDEIEIEAATRALLREYSRVIGFTQARNIAYTALVAARMSKTSADELINQQRYQHF